jgi:hypothetical protein
MMSFLCSKSDGQKSAEKVQSDWQSAAGNWILAKPPIGVDQIAVT